MQFLPRREKKSKALQSKDGYWCYLWSVCFCFFFSSHFCLVSPSALQVTSPASVWFAWCRTTSFKPSPTQETPSSPYLSSGIWKVSTARGEDDHLHLSCEWIMCVQTRWLTTFVHLWCTFSVRRRDVWCSFFFFFWQCWQYVFFIQWWIIKSGDGSLVMNWF